MERKILAKRNATYQAKIFLISFNFVITSSTNSHLIGSSNSSKALHSDLLLQHPAVTVIVTNCQAFFQLRFGPYSTEINVTFLYFKLVRYDHPGQYCSQ